MLKHQILNKIKKRDDGETVLNLFPVPISAIVLLALVVIFATWIANVDKKDSVDQIVRKYALKIETVGYLDEDAQDSLIIELKDAGMINPRWDVPIYKNGNYYETTTEAQSYGQPIYLAITGEIELNNPQLVQGRAENPNGIYSIIKGIDNVRYNVVRESTSKRSAKYEGYEEY